ncbi:putative NADH dehydrogenase/NAD(P)H nitroreductase [Rhizocola hellebori]|uniref:Putative NADH dehydrogenase/NAD(P)H nitroreductase n=1 Tax=Rhizocola hellebori TaxID=1392758 RepID=A0A8J3QED5_9ACTN|nr:putative NADH dehydrogenase/NAD(P)H nitroreductase [Rhizocola hellebori]
MSTSLRPLSATGMDLLFRNARTASTFTNTKVTDAQIKQIYDLVRNGPTSFNGQHLRIVLVRTKEARERLVHHMIEPNQAKTSAAPLVAILAADLKFTEHLAELYPPFPMAGDLFFSEAPVREEEAIFNASIQIGYFILAVRAVGLAAGPMGGFDAEGLAKEFFGDGRFKPLLVCNIGKPGKDAWFPDRLPRLDYKHAVSTL